jgi:hypothetical protein
MSNKIPKAIEAYLQTRVDYKDAKAASDAADKIHKGAKAALVEAMLEEQQQGYIPADDSPFQGLSFHLSDDFSIKCNAANREEVKTWLHERYGDLAEFTFEDVSKPSVVERLKNDIQGEKLDQDDVPEFFGLNTWPNVSCRGFDNYYRKTKG